MTQLAPRTDRRPLAASFGIVLGAAAPARLEDLAADEVGALLSRHGAVLWRGFQPSRDDFVAFSEACSRGFSTYQGGFFRDRQPVGGRETLLTVTGSQEGFAIPLHGEMYYTARQPQVLWFFCERPADQGGETTLCDGEEVWAGLGERTRGLFAESRVRYQRRLPDGAWQLAFQTGDLAEVESYCRRHDTLLTVDPESRLVTTDYLAWAAVPGRNGRPTAFVNNVVSLYLGELSLKRGTAAATIRELSGASFPIVVRMEDGRPVPGAAIKEIMALNQRLAVRVAWERGDVLLVDNTRILHGRLGFSGRRDVYVRLADRVGA